MDLVLSCLGSQVELGTVKRCEAALLPLDSDKACLYYSLKTQEETQPFLYVTSILYLHLTCKAIINKSILQDVQQM